MEIVLVLSYSMFFLLWCYVKYVNLSCFMLFVVFYDFSIFHEFMFFVFSHTYDLMMRYLPCKHLIIMVFILISMISMIFNDFNGSIPIYVLIYVNYHDFYHGFSCYYCIFLEFMIIKVHICWNYHDFTLFSMIYAILPVFMICQILMKIINMQRSSLSVYDFSGSVERLPLRPQIIEKISVLLIEQKCVKNT